MSTIECCARCDNRFLAEVGRYIRRLFYRAAHAQAGPCCPACRQVCDVGR